MIINDLNNIKNKKHFVIIIGSGPAGISTALELEKKKIPSLIIEAGGVEEENNSHDFLKGSVNGDTYNDLTISRLRQFGGTSGIWGGQCNPMKNEDFDGWPITKSELDHEKEISRKILNIDHKENFFLDKFSNNLDIYNLIWSNVKFNEKYFEYIKKSKYIYLSLNTAFLNFEGNNKSINLIKCKKNNNYYELKSKFYVLACGGIENSRILLWSKKINKNIFDPRMPIGNYFMDHPFYNVGSGLIIYEKMIEYFMNNTILNKPVLTCNDSLYFSANKRFLNKKNILNSGLYMGFQNVDENNNLFKQLRCVAPKFIKNIYENLKIKKTYEVDISILQEQKALKENRITLSDTKNNDGIPQAMIYWKKNNLEKVSARIIMEDLAKMFVDSDIGRLSINENLYDKGDYEVTVGNHQLGGTRMGLNINDSVVDKNLKIHNIENLYVSGSSTFRTGGHSHPTYTIVKLAVRLGNYLSKFSI
tara:strand:- start:133 stop:1560 length:1428 start_codon:yes stop_codon:yes gene_type:complete